MSHDKDWRDINAFVDGELSAAERAAMTQRLAADPDLARQAALAASLKGAILEGGFERPSQRLRLPKDPARTRRLGLRAAIAAAVAAVVVASVLQFGAPDGEHPNWLAAALERHHLLSQSPDGTQAITASLVSLRGHRALLPDLTAGKLTLASIGEFTGPGDSEGLAAHYRGTRGCRVTLFLMSEPPAGANAQLDRKEYGKATGFSWKTGGVGYLLLAEGMDEARLATIAEKVLEASRRLGPLDAEERVALAESRAESLPCKA